MAAGVVGIALQRALVGFFGGGTPETPLLDTGTREALEQEKALVLRSIKELEFDRAMRKVSDADFAEIGGRLRERALVLMAELDRPVAVKGLVGVPSPEPASEPEVALGPVASTCPSCAAANDS